MMNSDDQSPRDPESVGVEPGQLQAPDGEHAGRFEASTAPDTPPAMITAGSTTPAGQPQQGEREKRPEAAFWSSLSEAEQAALQALGQVRTFRTRQVICGEGEATTDVFVLIEGSVKILSAAGRRPKDILALRGRGDLIGDLAGNLAGHRTATAVAIGPVRALVVSHDNFTLFLNSNPEADRAYRRVLAQRTQEAENRSAGNGAQRLADRLLYLAARYGTPVASGTAIEIPLSQHELASFIGASRATVTRALGDWRSSGLIDTNWRQITIRDASGLLNVADRDTDSDAQALAEPTLSLLALSGSEGPQG